MSKRPNLAVPCGTVARPGARAPAGWIVNLLAGATSLQRRLMASLYRRQTERQLISLGDALLKDIGIHRSQVPWIASSLSRREVVRRTTEH
jgi:uncharacterized protein YjiS (DUF1127 family)